MSYGNYGQNAFQQPITLPDLNAKAGAGYAKGGGNALGGLAISDPNLLQTQQNTQQNMTPQNYYNPMFAPNFLGGGYIDGMSTAFVEAGTFRQYDAFGNVVRPGDPGYDYGSSMQSGAYGYGFGGMNPFGMGMPGGGYPGMYPGGYPQQQGINRTLFKPGSIMNPVAAGVAGFAGSKLLGGTGIGGAGAAAGSLIGKTDTEQALWGVGLSGASSFLLNGGLSMFKNTDDLTPEEQLERKENNLDIWGSVLADGIGGLGAILG